MCGFRRRFLSHLSSLILLGNTFLNEIKMKTLYVGRDIEQLELPYIVGGSGNGTTVWEKGLVWHFLMKLNICLRPNYLL